MFLRETNTILGRTAIVDEFGNEFTYGDLEALSLEYKASIPERSLVIILCDYSIETVAFYYCQMLNHAVPILVDKNLNSSMLLNIIKTYEPEFIWCPCGTEKDLCGLASDVVFKKENHIVMRTVYRSCEMDSQLALLLTTSGSTGSLKLVRLSYENLRENAAAYVAKVGMDHTDKAITTLPMYYCYGLSILHVHWIMGACICVTDRSVIDVQFWGFFKKAGITNFAGVSYTYDMLKQIEFLDTNYETLRFMTQGGTKLSAERQYEFGKRLQEKNIKLYICYGQTEATTYISILDYERVCEKLGSIGTPLSGMDISVINSSDNDMGELVCKGKSVSLGYAVNKSDLNRSDDNSGCLYTGDHVYIDEDGDIFIKGRESRFVKILGARVSLDEVEQALSGYFTNIDFACAGEDNKIRIYYLKENREGLEKEIRKFCSEELSIPRKLIECHFMREFPYTSNGKIQYKSL